MKAPKDFFRPMRDNGGPSHSNSLLSSYKALLVNVYYKLVQIPITECADHIIPRFLPLICTCDKSTLFYCNNNWLFPLASPLFCLLLSRLLGLSSCPPISTIIPMSFAHFFGAWCPNNLIRRLWYNHVLRWTLKHAQVVMHALALATWRMVSSFLLTSKSPNNTQKHPLSLAPNTYKQIDCK